MLPFAHLGITVFVLTLLTLPFLAAMIGSLLPDVLDKTLEITGIASCGRLFGHTIFFGPIAGLVSYAITRRKDFAVAIFLGCYMHLALDAKDFFPIFYPLVKYSFICLPTSIRIGIFEIVTESIGIILLAITLIYYSKIRRYGHSIVSKINHYLKIPKFL